MLIKIILFFCLIIATGYYLFLFYRFFKNVKIKFPEVWINLGKPDICIINKENYIIYAAISDYLKNEKYLSTNDSEFIKQCNVLRSSTKFFKIFLIVYGIFFIYFIVS